MASDEVDVQQPNSGKEGIAAKWRGFTRFIYNKDKKTFLERTGSSWGKIGLFYLVLYACLAAFFAVLLAVFFLTIEDERPKWSGYDSLLKDNPGVGFQPMPDHHSTLIQYTSASRSTYQVYTDYLTAYLSQYLNANDTVSCSGPRSEDDQSKACSFDTGLLGPCNAGNNFGYDKGKPCVLLKLNKVFGWKPANETTIEVACTGQNPADIDNMGAISYFPEAGWKPYYFPYLAQKNYKSPLVMVQFSNAVKGVLIMIECRALDSNIRYDRQLKQGSVRFELLID